MREQLSSSMTSVYKLLLPILWTAGLVGLVIELVTGDPGMQSLLFVLAVGAVFIYRVGVRLVHVVALQDGLLVSGLSIDTVIPYADIDSVSENRWTNLRPTTLRLSRPSPLGKWIVFIPALQFTLMPWQDHPTATRIRELAGLRLQ